MLLKQLEDTRSSLLTRADFSKYNISIPALETALHVSDLKVPMPYKSSIIEFTIQKMDAGDAEILKKILILKCAISNWTEIFSDNYPKSIIEQYIKTFERILDTCISKIGWSKGNIDVYWKDLAMARRIIFPAGAQIVEYSSGFSVKQGLTRRVSETLSFLNFLATQKGNKNYFQIHTHTPELGQFNEKGWNECYLRIAEMLECNPDVKGVFGGSWFYDPKLAKISPNLMYLQKTPLENGACSFYVGKDTSNNAISKSKTRRKLYEDGNYDPEAYLLIWPREKLISWAKAHKPEIRG